MKSLLASVVFLALLLTSSANALAQSKNYKHLIHTGEIKDAKGVTIGMVTKDQIINDSKKKLGRMGKDGKTYYNSNGELVFTVQEKGETCEIFDASGKKIGDVHSSLKASACALACFEGGHDHQKSTIKK